MTNYNDLKEAAEDLATALASAKAAGNVDGTADLAAMLARVQDAISQIEAAHELLFEAEDLLDKYTPNLEEALPDITGEIEELAAYYDNPEHFTGTEHRQAAAELILDRLAQWAGHLEAIRQSYQAGPKTAILSKLILNKTIR